MSEDWMNIKHAPKEVSDYSYHGPYILIKTIKTSHDGGNKIEVVRTCYWDETVGWWQIDTDGEHEFCGLQCAEEDIIGWKYPEVAQ